LVAATPAQVEQQWWDAVFMQGQKIGRSHTQQRTETDPATGKERRITSANITLRVLRFGQTLDIELKQESVETPAGELLAFTSSQLTGPQAVTARGAVQKGFLQITVASQGKESQSLIPWEPDTLGFFGVEQSLKRQPMRPGETRQVKFFLPVLHQVTVDQLTAEQEEEVDLLPGRQRLLRIRVLSRPNPGAVTETVLWTNPAGEVLRSHVKGVDQLAVRTTREIALAPAEQLFDLGRATMVKATRPLLNHTEMEQVTYQVRLREGDPLQIFPAGLSQRVQRIDPRTARVIVQRIRPDQPRQVAESASHNAADLAPNSLIQSDDQRVLALAQEVAAEESDPWRVAVALERMVREKITVKDFSQAFATAAEVAESLEGDCTEHAVLLAALCRARKIPARVAAGLVYYDREQAFAYHMWNEVWIVDRWVPLDATLARGGIGGGHLKLFDSNLEGAGAFAAFVPVMNVLGQLELEILEAP
jgi:transglutaminase-like putative cysteine protease